MPQNRKLQNLMDGRMAKAMDDGENYGFLPVMIRVDTAAGATNTVALTMDRPFTVVDCKAQNIGGAGGGSDTLQLKNGSSAITDAMDMNIADNVFARAASVDDAQMEIAAAGTLNVVATDGSGSNQMAKLVYITGYYHV